jgi:hypothetical protein
MKLSKKIGRLLNTHPNEREEVLFLLEMVCFILEHPDVKRKDVELFYNTWRK